ncbi:F0F1 ATP synthase subunit A [Hippea maritima]|uniref:ATP synthase subunit a n=1 Tax=Hippea maritima (strain ATCC 700847 / DSM 10411 / MH2) TaxID=760142 RepID=F2LVN4_HIPMA|nr:F0F1 ATP synthase subunit A [Hippea maritima]AEA33818.1 ATP synthase subunit a [Hippea maritima DSM 10411]
MEAPSFLDFIIHVTGLPGYLVFSWFMILVIISLALIVRSSLKLMPEGIQNVAESVVYGIYSFVEDILGKEETPKHFPLLATLAIVIFFYNIVELIPGFIPPTSNLNTTLSMALIVFLYYQFLGFKRHGIKYIKHFMGPVWWLVPLILPIEIIGHFARIVSLSVRLFGNIFGDDLLLAVVFFLAPWLVPLPVMALVLLAASIQAFIFFLLSTLYIADAINEAH